MQRGFRRDSEVRVNGGYRGTCVTRDTRLECLEFGVGCEFPQLNCYYKYNVVCVCHTIRLRDIRI